MIFQCFLIHNQVQRTVIHKMFQQYQTITQLMKNFSLTLMMVRSLVHCSFCLLKCICKHSLTALPDIRYVMNRIYTHFKRKGQFYYYFIYLLMLFIVLLQHHFMAKTSKEIMVKIFGSIYIYVCLGVCVCVFYSFLVFLFI